jgi:hypothetical protein
LDPKPQHMRTKQTSESQGGPVRAFKGGEGGVHEVPVSSMRCDRVRRPVRGRERYQSKEENDKVQRLKVVVDVIGREEKIAEN